MVFNAPIVPRNPEEKGLKVQSTKAGSPLVVHYDAIYHAYLQNGVRSNIGRATEDSWVVVRAENDDRYHIRTICRQVAYEFLGGKRRVEERKSTPPSRGHYIVSQPSQERVMPDATEETIQKVAAVLRELYPVSL